MEGEGKGCFRVVHVCVDDMIVHTVRYCSSLGCTGLFLSACVTVDSTVSYSLSGHRVALINTLIPADVEIQLDI